MCYLERANFVTISLLLLVSNVVAEDRRIKDGLPVGYLSDCPGSTKEVIISNRSLKHLQIAVLGHGNFLTAKKTIYNYHQMKELAANTDFNKEIFMFMHGYMDHISLPVSALMGIPYKKLGYNVWVLHYSEFAFHYYPIATRILRAVGQRAAEMLAKLTEFGFNPKKFHLLGISLGGQGISFVAKNYRRITGMNLSHVTGLDPAGPCFRNLGPDDRLDISDADFVEVVHTNIDAFGMAGRMGHVDFYVNGGEYQVFDVPFLPCDFMCSHAKSFLYWVSALKNPKSFIAIQCDSIQDARDGNCYDRKPLVTNYLGEYVNKSRHGIFFLPATYEYPYFLGDKVFEKKNSFMDQELTMVNSKDVLRV